MSDLYTKKRICFLPFLLQCTAYGGLVVEDFLYGTLTHNMLPLTLAWVALAFAGYGLAAWQMETSRGISQPLVWSGAILFRGLLLFTLPTLSSDVYRYLWDGHVANSGVSPYAFAIDSPQLDWLQTSVREQANHAWMASPYLPAAQALFGAVTALMPLQPLSMQFAMVLIDLMNGLLIAALLPVAGLPRRRVLIYLWNPLVVVEIAHGAHVDGWMIFLSLSALYLFFCTPKWLTWLSPPVLALATLTKILPGFFMAVLFWRWRWVQIALYTGVAAALLVAAASRAGWGLVGPLDGRGLFGALRIYADRWNYNSGLFHWLEASLGPAGYARLNLEVANEWAKRLVSLGLLGVLGATWLIAKRHVAPLQLIRLMSVPLMGYTLLATTVHPWYLLFLLAFVPFLTPAEQEPGEQWLWVLPWLYLSAALFLSYLTYLNPDDLREHEWIRKLEWLPLYALLASAALKWLSSQNLNISFRLF